MKRKTKQQLKSVAAFVVIVAAFLYLCSSCDGFDDSDTVTSSFNGTGEFWTYSAVELDQSVTKNRLSGSGTIDIFASAEWNDTGSSLEVTGTVDFFEPDWKNKYITGVAHDRVGAHRVEMSDLGDGSVSTSLYVDDEEIRSSTTIGFEEAYLENIVETLNVNATHLSDRTRTYFNGSDLSGTFEYMSVIPPGGEGDWLACMSCVDEFDAQPDWTSEEDIFGYGNVTSSDDGESGDDEDDIIIS